MTAIESGVGARLTPDEIGDYLSDLAFAPFTLGNWHFEWFHLPHGIGLKLVNSFARDARTYDPNPDVIDEWDPLDDGVTQSFVRGVDRWPASLDELRQEVVTLAAYALAHEATEWLYELVAETGTYRQIHDPHGAGGEVEVHVTRVAP